RLERVEPEDHGPEHGGGHRARHGVCGFAYRRAYQACDRPDRGVVRPAALARPALRTAVAAARRHHPRDLRNHRRLSQPRRPMLANAGGPAWQMHLLPQRLDKFSYVGTFAILFAASNVFKVPAYAALGQLTVENLKIGVLLLPVAIASNYAGIWLVRKTPTEL